MGENPTDTLPTDPAQGVAEGKGKGKVDYADVSMGEDEGESSDEETGAEDEVRRPFPSLPIFPLERVIEASFANARGFWAGT